MLRSIRASHALSVAFGVIAALANKTFAATLTINNSTPITIPAPGTSSGSEISISGLGNSITPVSGPETIPSDVTVELLGFTATKVQDVDLVLVGPTGAALVLMGDAGGSTTAATNLTLTFDDRSSVRIPQTSLTTSGSFQPTQYASIGSFPSPGPGTAYNSPATFGTSNFDQTFANTNPNGNWWLYAMDPVSSADTAEITQGWSLQVTAVPEPASLATLAVGSAICLIRRPRVLSHPSF